MSETKWTPGAWDWAPASEATDGKRSVLLSEARVFTVAGGTSRDIATVGNDRAAEANANARLIASAPVLYAALNEIVSKRESACRVLGGSPDGSDGRYARARAALARARGETP